MRRMPSSTYLWPGLPQLWWRGSWGGLAVAVGAAAVLDVLLVISFGWSELIGGNLRTTLWASFGVAWVAAIAWSARQYSLPAAAGHPGPPSDAFAEAMDHYLRGDYFQAEHLLEDLLRRNLRDLDARLMLATLLRHAGRTEEAVRQLDTLARFEGAGKWELEMRRERELLASATTKEKEAVAT